MVLVLLKNGLILLTHSSSSALSPCLYMWLLFLISHLHLPLLTVMVVSKPFSLITAAILHFVLGSPVLLPCTYRSRSLTSQNLSLLCQQPFYLLVFSSLHHPITVLHSFPHCFWHCKNASYSFPPLFKNLLVFFPFLLSAVPFLSSFCWCYPSEMPFILTITATIFIY